MTVNTLIFGPTGGVAAEAVKYAASKGAHVGLAMRDPSKKLDYLSAEQESSGKFTRVKADLTDAESVAAAVKATSAQTAFIYLIFGPTLTPPESIQALKDGGVKHVVFLSSYSVTDPVEDVPKEDMIGWSHAQVEMSLHKIFGEGNYTALRPAFFATNLFRFAGQVKAGVVKEVCPDNLFDFIVAKDIGEVGASLLLRESGPLPRVVILTGQQKLSEADALKTLARANGREIAVETLNVEEGTKHYMESYGYPEHFARYFCNMLTKQHDEEGGDIYQDWRYEEGKGNVKKYLGRDAITFPQWVEENKAAFA